jgi:hypothetical protein
MNNFYKVYIVKKNNKNNLINLFINKINSYKIII